MEIVETFLNSSSRAIELKWSDGCTLHYPFPWLRENCQCNDCFFQTIHLRSFLFHTLDPKIEPTKIEIGKANQLRVTWPDGHERDYTPEWLYKRGFRTESPVQYMEPLDKKPPRLWGKELEDKIPTMQFEEILSEDSALYQWIVHLEETGLCLLQGAPAEPGQLRKIANQISHLSYIFSAGFTFDVKVKVDACSPAYTSGTLGLHTDSACLEVTPGMQMLHCITQTSCSGGANYLADGFYVAKQIEQDYPEMYKLLTTVPMYYSEHHRDAYDYFMAFKHPVIELDVSGRPDTIYWSGHTKESRQNHLPLSTMQPLYEALCKFHSLAMDNRIDIKMKPGDIICMHNQRIMHARTGYTLQENEERHLEGGYLSWDDLRSKRRVLEAQLKKTS